MFNDNSSKKRPPLTPQTPVQYLKGVGPKKADLLAHLGIHTIEDLLLTTPRKWEDRRIETLQTTAIDLHEEQGAKRTLLCSIERIREIVSPYKEFTFFKAAGVAADRKLQVMLTWIRRRAAYDVFNRVRQDVRPGTRLLAYGKVQSIRDCAEISVDDYCPLPEHGPGLESAHWLRLVPQYHSTEGLTQKQLRELRWNTQDLWDNANKAGWDWSDLRTRHLPADLLGLTDAYKTMHFPRDERHLQTAQTTLAFWEFLLMAVAMEWRKARTLKHDKPLKYHRPSAKGAWPTKFNEVLSASGLKPTADQACAIDEILNDLSAAKPMNRLLQGEVGSGKTLVAIAAICQAISHGYQAAFIAPTEILVFQHYLTLKRALDTLGVKTAYLTSETAGHERETIIAGLGAGTIQVVVGTHSLLGADVGFKALSLIVIDEQQRFGVTQRWRLRCKADHPDSLILTATPIPRTMALALYGDLDISTMKELPQGHRIAETQLIEDEGLAFAIVADRLKRGQQAYIVTPAIEPGQTLQSGAGDPPAYRYNLEQEAKRIKGLFTDKSVACLHGRMHGKAKESTLNDFATGKHHILIATTVIEVGIDVPNASVIVILGAERFGLATLHQLRGRVGRGQHPGVCVLVPTRERRQEQNDILSGEPAARRLERFCATSNGFDIGRLDLELRGHGELLGHAQHGADTLRHFDFLKHEPLIAPARAIASEILASGRSLKSYPYIKESVMKKFGVDMKDSDIS